MEVLRGGDPPFCGGRQKGSRLRRCRPRAAAAPCPRLRPILEAAATSGSLCNGGPVQSRLPAGPAPAAAPAGPPGALRASLAGGASGVLRCRSARRRRRLAPSQAPGHLRNAPTLGALRSARPRSPAAALPAALRASAAPAAAPSAALRALPTRRTGGPSGQAGRPPCLGLVGRPWAPAPRAPAFPPHARRCGGGHPRPVGRLCQAPGLGAPSGPWAPPSFAPGALRLPCAAGGLAPGPLGGAAAPPCGSPLAGPGPLCVPGGPAARPSGLPPAGQGGLRPPLYAPPRRR